MIGSHGTSHLVSQKEKGDINISYSELRESLRKHSKKNIHPQFLKKNLMFCFYLVVYVLFVRMLGMMMMMI